MFATSRPSSMARDKLVKPFPQDRLCYFVETPWRHVAKVSERSRPHIPCYWTPSKVGNSRAPASGFFIIDTLNLPGTTFDAHTQFDAPHFSTPKILFIGFKGNMNSNELECNQVVPPVQVHGSEMGKHEPNNLVGSHTLHILYKLTRM